MRIPRIAKWIGVVILIVLASCGAAFFMLIHTFYPSVPAPDFPAPADRKTAQQQDFEYFHRYFDYEGAYSPIALARAKELLAEEEKKVGTLSPAQFDLAIARIAALADNGHSRVSPGPLSRAHNRLPCRFYHFSDGYFVVRARPACEPLLGAQLVAIDGHDIAEVVDRLFEYVRGPRNHYDQFGSLLLIESPELLHAAGVANADDRVTLRLKAADGTIAETVVVADAADPEGPRVYADSYLSPEGIEKEAADWQPLLPKDAKLPSFLRDYTVPFRTEFDKDRSIYVAQFRSNEDEPGYPITPFVERVRNEIIADRPRFIVLDLRLDQGGNFTKTASLMEDLTTLSNSIEHVYVLTSAWTFSAGDVSLALVKEHGGDKVTVVGELAGDRVRMWAEGDEMVLPNSKLHLHFATGLHDYSKSCRGEPGCFWVMYFYPMHVASFEPDVPVAYTFDDYTNLRDPFMEKTLMLIRSRSGQAGGPPQK